LSLRSSPAPTTDPADVQILLAVVAVALAELLLFKYLASH
jgi:hypothetical protein